MLARGYDGTARTLYLYKVGMLEVAFLFLLSVVPLAARLLSRG
jgi:energy-coupling factor transporter transmembrane protein EcfT